MNATFLKSNELLEHWQGHRNLTRRVIEKFPEKELFEFSVGGMRTFAELSKELLAIAVPGLKEITINNPVPFDEKREDIKTKADILKAWDESTVLINEYFNQISEERFRETHNLFGLQLNQNSNNSVEFFWSLVVHKNQIRPAFTDL